MKRFHFILAVLILTLSSAFAAHAGIPPKSGSILCQGLVPADFANVGIANASLPKTNVSEGGASAYCVYSGQSSATGGIELDVFYPAGANAIESKATLETAIGESSSIQKPIAVAGADEASWSPHAVSGGPPFATIAVRRANLVFVIGVPAGKDAQTQLLKLADIVL